ncbi:MAG: hypothetical protein JW807_12225 [Spirochaetes bacterium]|nr:hypothetical protein [Spirochaetota bacterium]
METTLNINYEILEKLLEAAGDAGVSRSEMIVTLIKKAMDDIPDPARMGTMVRYQKRRKRGEWRRIHLQIRIDDYEYFLDLRKLLKMSVSYILAYAVKKYLPGLIINKTDNNRYRNYVVIRDTIDNVICWKILWGWPYTIEKILPHP